MGSGRIVYHEDSERYLIDLSVASAYTLSNDDLLLWEASFRFASQYLFHATNGKMQLGRVGLLPTWHGPNDDDAWLEDKTDHSDSSFEYLRETNQVSFSDYRMFLSRIAQVKPLEVTHELFHYVVGLADEYVDGATPRCTADAGTGACIMEFAADHSILLEVVGGVVQIAAQSALIEVTQLCFPAESGWDIQHQSNSDNIQQQKHSESCWDTLHKHYPSVPIPAAPTDQPTHAMSEVDWFIRQAEFRIALTIYGSSLLSQQNRFDAVKRTLLAKLKSIAGGETKVAIYVDTPQPFQRNLQPVPEPTNPGFTDLLESIRNLTPDANPSADQSRGRPLPFLSPDFFDRNDVAAWQTQILIAPNSLEAELDAEQIHVFADRLADQFVNLRASFIGSGEFHLPFADHFTSVNPRFRSALVRHQDSRREKIVFQGTLIENLIYQTPGLELTTVRTGTIPRSARKNLSFDQPDQEQALKLHPLADGFDIPFLVETGASEIRVWINQLSDDLRMSIVDPSSNTVASNVNVEPVGDLDAIGLLNLESPEAGRWLLRLVRNSHRPVNDENVPFEVLIAVANQKIRTQLSVQQLAKGHTRFQASVQYGIGLLDFVTVTAKIFDASQYGAIGPVASIWLTRQRMSGLVAGTDDSLETEVSTGRYQAILDLEPGDYIAEVSFQSSGAAVFANHYSRELFDLPRSVSSNATPAFSRTQRIHFHVEAHH